ncbi:MAG: zf-HC2 domain-containing protein [Pyrinomonadaceae bacterium]
MENNGQMTLNEQKIQAALGSFIRARGHQAGTSVETAHLDEDLLTTFVEGNLTESEARPIVNHLAGCSYCLHVSAELLKLSEVFAEEPAAIVSSSVEAPTSIGEVLSGILSRIFGSTEGAVFAHEEKEAEEDDASEEE